MKIFALLLTFFLSSPAHGQIGFLTNILNPEGSRLFPQILVVPRHSGKPDTRWRAFSWRFVDKQVMETPFRLYFYDSGLWAARFALPFLETQIAMLQERFDYQPTKRFSYLLFTTEWEFRQANLFNISEGVRGITSTTEATMALPYLGERKEFDHISAHELVHQFQVQKATELDRSHRGTALQLLPLWFIEGMAEYYSLGGMNPEGRMFLRDLRLNPQPDRNYVVPDFFAPGAMDFVNVYKVGQAKVAFLDSEFGRGTAQKLFTAAAEAEYSAALNFVSVVEKTLALDGESIERRWFRYVRDNFSRPKGMEGATWDDFAPFHAAGDTLDYYDISPDGRVVALRKVDPLTGISSIRLLETARDHREISLIEDKTPGALSLNFMQAPSLTVSDNFAAYAVVTAAGPEIEGVHFGRDEEGGLRVEDRWRFPAHPQDVVQIGSLAVRPDGRSLAFVGTDIHGWQNVYLLDLSSGKPTDRAIRLTDGYYSCRTLSWSGEDLLLASDRTSDGNYALFRLGPATGALVPLPSGGSDAFGPSAALGGILFHSMASGTAQIHFRGDKGQERRITMVSTGVFYPRLRGDTLYALGLYGGRYRLFRAPAEILAQGSARPPVPPALGNPWVARLAYLDPAEIQTYRPFTSKGTRLDGLMAFLSGANGGLMISASDLMRDYGIAAELTYFRQIGVSSAGAFLSSRRGRLTWTTGAYHVLRPQLDAIFAGDDKIRTYRLREFGALVVLQYPLGAYSYVDAGVRLAGARRFQFSDRALSAKWEAINPGTELLVAPTLRLGYDRILYELFSGPLQGYGFLFEADSEIFPVRGDFTERLRLDVAWYIPVFQRMLFALQGMAGATLAGKYRNPFFISSNDVMRAYPMGDERLMGNYYGIGKAELRFPIGDLFGFPVLRGLLAWDYGTIFDKPQKSSSGISSSATGGLTLNVPPLSLNFLLSFPLKVAAGPRYPRVVHFTLRYLYL